MQWLLRGLLVSLAIPSWSLASDPAEELPPPKTEISVLTKAAAPSQSGGQNPWGFVGPHFRCYILGTDGVIDYQWQGQRCVEKLQAEDPANHAKPDPNFWYFREGGTSNRWAISHQPGTGGLHRVYFQAADTAKGWVLREWARGTWQPETVAIIEEATPVLLWDEPTCGR